MCGGVIALALKPTASLMLLPSNLLLSSCYCPQTYCYPHAIALKPSASLMLLPSNLVLASCYCPQTYSASLML